MHLHRIICAALLAIAAVGIHAEPRRRAVSRLPLFQLGPEVALRDLTSTREALWFSSDKAGSEAIGRVDRSGHITLFPTPGLSPRHIAAAPDGSIWLAVIRSDGVHGLTRMSSSGSFAPLWLPGVTLSQIAAESSERVWYSDWSRRRVGSLTIHGDTFETDGGQGSNSLFAYLAVGSDGAVWMASGHKIIRLKVDRLREWDFADAVLNDTQRPFVAIAVTPEGIVYAMSRPERDIGVGFPHKSVLVRIDLDESATTGEIDFNLWPSDLVVVDEILYVAAHAFGAYGYPFPHVIRIDRSTSRMTASQFPNLMPFPTTAMIAGIALGPDGSIWFGYTGGWFLIRL